MNPYLEKLRLLQESSGVTRIDGHTLEKLLDGATNEQRREVEAALLVETDNGPKPGDGDQAAAIAPEGT